jgi:hypothetical protein
MTMRQYLTIRPARETYAQARLGPWRAYCAELHDEVPDETSEALWWRILAAEQSIGVFSRAALQ